MRTTNRRHRNSCGCSSVRRFAASAGEWATGWAAPPRIVLAAVAALALLEAPPALGDTALQVAVGAQHSCAVNSAGGVVCWGLNPTGELGDGMPVPGPQFVAPPVPVVGLASGVASVDVGEI